MEFALKIEKGYGIDVSGGPTIISFKEPSSRSDIIETYDVGAVVYANEVSGAADGRIWFKLIGPVGGWIIGTGNTGVKYVRITHTTPPTEYAYAEIHIGAIHFIPDISPALPSPLPPPTNTAYDAAKTIVKGVDAAQQSITTYPVSLSTPIVEAVIDDKPTYTEGNAPIISGVNTAFGLTTNIEVYNNFTSSDNFINALNTAKQHFDIRNQLNYVTITDDLIERFNRFKIDFPDYHLNKSFSHVFFTRPDLNILENADKLLPTLSTEPTFYYLFRNNKKLLLSLTNMFTGKHDLMPFLSNLADSFEISDEFIKTMDHGETFTGYKMQYGKHNIESKTAGSISINYIDDNSLSVYKIHKAWVEYISKVFRGELRPKLNYIHNKELDYAVSAYYIVCGPDGETILFWSKYYGVFPTSIPSSIMSWSKGSFLKIPEYNINYSYSVKEDFNPLILAEFNNNSGGDYIYKPSYVKGIGRSGSSLAGNPFIETVTDNLGKYVFKLRFRE